MKIFRPRTADGYELIHPVDRADFEFFRMMLNGQPRQREWKPIKMKLIHDDGCLPLAYADAPSMVTSELYFREHVVKTLSPLLHSCGEFLPLVCDEADVFVYNTTRFIDALDESRSELSRGTDGRIMYIRKACLKGELAQGVDAFRLPVASRPTFFSERVVNLWKSAGFVGLDFKLIETS